MPHNGVFQLKRYGIATMVVGLALWILFPTAFAARVLNEGIGYSAQSRHQDQLWEQVMTCCITRTGWVDAGRLKQDPRLLQRYVNYLAQTSPATLPDRFPTQFHRLAYWVNAHNALSLFWMVHQYPRPFSPDAMARFAESKAQIGGQWMTLADIRHQVSTELGITANPETPPGSPKILSASQRAIFDLLTVWSAMETQRVSTSVNPTTLQLLLSHSEPTAQGGCAPPPWVAMEPDAWRKQFVQWFRQPLSGCVSKVEPGDGTEVTVPFRILPVMK